MGLIFPFSPFTQFFTRKSSSDPRSSFYAGGSYNEAYPLIQQRILPLFDRTKSVVDLFQTQPILFPDASGFLPYQYAGLQEMGNQMFSSVSADLGRRGQIMAQNLPSVLGSSLTRLGPALFALQERNQLLPYQQAAARIQQAQGLANVLSPLTQAGMRSLGPGLDYLNMKQADAEWWNMLNKIGTFWGTSGAAGGMGGMKGFG